MALNRCYLSHRCHNRVCKNLIIVNFIEHHDDPTQSDILLTGLSENEVESSSDVLIRHVPARTQETKSTMNMYLNNESVGIQWPGT